MMRPAAVARRHPSYRSSRSSAHYPQRSSIAAVILRTVTVSRHRSSALVTWRSSSAAVDHAHRSRHPPYFRSRAAAPSAFILRRSKATQAHRHRHAPVIDEHRSNAAAVTRPQIIHRAAVDNEHRKSSCRTRRAVLLHVTSAAYVLMISRVLFPAR